MFTDFTNWAFGLLGKRAFKQINKEILNPMAVQEKELLQLIRDNENTEYGRKYHFNEIKTIEDYQRLVPVITYNDIEEYIARMRDGEPNILTVYPFNHMNMTSGTSGKFKTIPFTNKQMDMFKKYNSMYNYGLIESKLKNSWIGGRCFCATSGHLDKLPSGITIGHANAKVIEYLCGNGGPKKADKVLRTIYTSPFEATIVDPMIDNTYIQCRFFLEDGHVTGIITHFFSHLVPYLKYIADNYRLLINDIENGIIDEGIVLPDDIRASLSKKIKPNPKRAKQLRKIFENGSDFPYGKQVWPRLEYLIGVGGDGFTVYDTMIKEKYLGKDINYFYAGLQSTEGLYSAPFEANNFDSQLLPGGSFMEFLPIEVGNDFSKIVTMDKVEKGKVYELVITNFGGLYRYRLSDAVLITGHHENTPTVQFMYRVNKTVNMIGEKTTEKALEIAVYETAKELGFDLYDFNFYADFNKQPGQYVFLIEPRQDVRNITRQQLKDAIYRNLCKANEAFPHFVDMEKIQKPDAYFLQPETNLLYRDCQVMKGVSQTTIKPVHIIAKESDRKFFFRFIDKAVL